jgi:hypothetical protein
MAMNYDDLLSKCQGILSPEDYMRLCELIVREKERSERIKELNELALDEMVAINQKLGLYDE